MEYCLICRKCCGGGFFCVIVCHLPFGVSMVYSFKQVWLCRLDLGFSLLFLLLSIYFLLGLIDDLLLSGINDLWIKFVSSPVKALVVCSFEIHVV